MGEEAELPDVEKMGLEDGYEYQALRGHGLTGFWESFASHVKASVDWCELNYDLSMYICEFFNTISSFSMVRLVEFSSNNYALGPKVANEDFVFLRLVTLRVWYVCSL